MLYTFNPNFNFALQLKFKMASSFIWHIYVPVSTFADELIYLTNTLPIKYMKQGNASNSTYPCHPKEQTTSNNPSIQYTLWKKRKNSRYEIHINPFLFQLEKFPILNSSRDSSKICQRLRHGVYIKKDYFA